MEHREESDRMQSLNGTWKFWYLDSIYDVQETFLSQDEIEIEWNFDDIFSEQR